MTPTFFAFTLLQICNLLATTQGSGGVQITPKRMNFDKFRPPLRTSEEIDAGKRAYEVMSCFPGRAVIFFLETPTFIPEGHVFLKDAEEVYTAAPCGVEERHRQMEGEWKALVGQWRHKYFTDRRQCDDVLMFKQEKSGELNKKERCFSTGCFSTGEELQRLQNAAECRLVRRQKGA